MELKMLEEELQTISSEISSTNLSTKTKDEREELYLRRRKLQELKEILSSEKIASSDEIDLYEVNVSYATKHYKITLHNQFDVIGCIRVTYLRNITYKPGNIGYEIDEKYRGHNYTIKALEMLSDTILEKGLIKPILSAYPHNLASNHIIQKFGGNLIASRKNGFPYNVYEVDLLKKKDKNKLKIKEK